MSPAHRCGLAVSFTWRFRRARTSYELVAHALDRTVRPRHRRPPDLEPTEDQEAGVVAFEDREAVAPGLDVQDRPGAAGLDPNAPQWGPDSPFGGDGFRPAGPRATGRVMQFRAVLPSQAGFVDLSTPADLVVMPPVTPVSAAV